MSDPRRDEMSDAELDELLGRADRQLESALGRVLDLAAGLRAIEQAAAREGQPPTAQIIPFPLPAPPRGPEVAAEVAAATPGGSLVWEATSPDGNARFLLYDQGDGDYWLEVSLADAVPVPVVVELRHAAEPSLLIPVYGGLGGDATLVVRLPRPDAASWAVASAVAPVDLAAWPEDLVTASVMAAVSDTAERAWRRLADDPAVPAATRALIADLIAEDLPDADL